LHVEDLRFEKRGLIVTIPRTKTDQEAKGAEMPFRTSRIDRSAPRAP
jgi:hypothetical protein